MKREIAQKSVILLPWQPKYSGMSGWVKMLKKSLEREVSVSIKDFFFKLYLKYLSTIFIYLKYCLFIYFVSIISILSLSILH